MHLRFKDESSLKRSTQTSDHYLDLLRQLEKLSQIAQVNYLPCKTLATSSSGEMCEKKKASIYHAVIFLKIMSSNINTKL